MQDHGPWMPGGGAAWGTGELPFYILSLGRGRRWRGVVIAQTIHLNRLPLKPLFFTLPLALAAAGEEGDMPPER